MNFSLDGKYLVSGSFKLITIWKNPIYLFKRKYFLLYYLKELQENKEINEYIIIQIFVFLI